jgi:hypothetical protein
MNGTENMQDNDEIMRSRELFMVPVSLDENEVFCGDDRPADIDIYIHMFGGALNTAYGFVIMKEISEPGSVSDTFEDEVHSVVPVILHVAKVNAGVHSDQHTEQGSTLKTAEIDGDIGCAYALKRREISGGIFQDGDLLIGQLEQLRPELLESEADRAFASSVVAAHGRLAKRDGFFTSGRRVALAAASEGAPTTTVTGEHAANSKGIINLEPNTSLHTRLAQEASLPAYMEDSWAVKEINDRLRSLYPYDSRQQEIAEAIDTLGTMRALGLKPEDITVRERW